MWAIAVYDLGLTGRQFGRLNYRTLGALVHRKNLRTQLEDYRAGAVCSLIANYIAARGGSQKNYPASHFFPSLQSTERRQTPDEMRAALRAYAALQKA